MTAANIANTKIIPVESTVYPYYDDFDESKNFHRILFRPGYAVQARELTQSQSVLQNQIERFGNHIFKNGSLVSGGQISIDSVAVSLNLQTQYNGTDINVSSFLNKSITYSTGNNTIKAYCLGTVANTGANPPTITLKYLTGNEFVASDVIKTSDNVYANVANSAANNRAMLASISDGVFFINGYFVKTPSQTIVISRYNQTANVKVGLEFDDTIIDEGSDTSLLDPAQESTNYQAPGASRYKIDLNFTTRALDSIDDDKFIELVRIESGQVKRQTKYPIYGDLEDTLARRTFDESGSYTVRPFKLSIIDHPSDANSVQAIIDPGKAYVQGYEFESIAQEFLTIPRARDTATITNYPLSENYGNYITVQDIRGLPNISAMDIVDIHCSPWTSVSNTVGGTPSGSQYRSSKIGTARIRNIEYDSASNTSNTLTRTYKLYLFDTKFSNLTTNVVSATSNSMIIFDPSALAFSNVNGAYTGATMRITGGTGSGQSLSINNYSVSGATKNLQFMTAFSTVPTVTSNISIDFDFGQAESLILIPSFSSNITSSADWYKFNISTASKGGNANSPAVIAETSIKKLVFTFPQSFIKYGSLTGQNYQYRKVFPSVAFTTGTATVSIVDPNEVFNGGAGGSGTSSAVLTNYIISVTDKKASAVYANGDIISPSTISVSTGAGTSTATITLPTSETVTATVTAKINLNNGAGISPKTKTLFSGNTTVFNPTTAASNGSFSTVYADATSNVTVYLNNGQATIETPTKTPGLELSLFTSDVKTIQKIYDLNGTSATAGLSLAAFTDIKSRYFFNTGQRDTHYDFGTIKLLSGQQSPVGPLVVCYDWYDHSAGVSDGLGYFSLDSYPSANTTAGYAAIPNYITESGTSVSLRDSIDFRPRKTNASNTSPNYSFQGTRIPSPGDNFDTTSYQYYLPRRDKIVLTKDKQFKLVSGTSEIFPQEPYDIADSMVLYRLYSPAYTLSPSNVQVKYVENKRYTMRDIGTLETRIQNLEYYTTLSFLEKDATGLLITDTNGLDRIKYGILVDGFNGHSIGDVTNADYDCAMDYTNGGMTPRNLAIGSKLVATANSNMKISGQVATLSYTEETFVSQGFATKSVNVQPYMFGFFAGSLRLWPDGDVWVDEIKAPSVITNPSGINDNFVSVPPSQNTDPHGGKRRWWTHHHHGERSSGGRVRRDSDDRVTNSTR